MSGDKKLALLLTFPCWYLGAVCAWLATTGTSIVQPDPSGTGLFHNHPTGGFIFGAVFMLGLGAFLLWSMLRPGGMGGWSDAPVDAQPSDTTAKPSQQVSTAPSGRQSVKSWTGRSAMWAVVIEILFALVGVGALVALSIMFLSAGVSELAVVGVVLVWILGAWLVWLILWALSFVAPTTFRMDGRGIEIRRFRQPAERLAYSEIADVTWVPSVGRATGGLDIRPKNVIAADGHTLSDAEVESQWFLGVLLFSDKQWKQIRAALAQAMTDAGGSVDDSPASGAAL